jgi:uncharacterized protein
MLISLARLPVEGLAFEHQYGPDELDITGHEFRFRDAPRVVGRVDRAGSEIRLRGDVSTVVFEECDRCLKDVEIPVEAKVDLLYAADDPGSGKGSESEVHGRDLDVALYENDTIDIDQMVREQIELNLPPRVLCEEDCRGLCPQCGANLNIEECGCARPVDPVWRALADFKPGSKS